MVSVGKIGDNDETDEKGTLYLPLYSWSRSLLLPLRRIIRRVMDCYFHGVAGQMVNTMSYMRCSVL